LSSGCPISAFLGDSTSGGGAFAELQAITRAARRLE
jgi:hypothetical protein